MMMLPRQIGQISTGDAWMHSTQANACVLCMTETAYACYLAQTIEWLSCAIPVMQCHDGRLDGNVTAS